MKDCASNSRRAFATAAIVLESILAQQYPNRGLVSQACMLRTMQGRCLLFGQGGHETEDPL